MYKMGILMSSTSATTVGFSTVLGLIKSYFPSVKVTPDRIISLPFLWFTTGKGKLFLFPSAEAEQNRSLPSADAG